MFKLFTNLSIYPFIHLSIYLSISYPIALEMVASGKVNVKPLITHHYQLEQSLDAFQQAKTGDDGAIKVMIHCGK